MFPIIDQDDDTQGDDQTQVTWSEQPIVPASLSETTHDFWVQHEAYSCEVCCTSPCRCPTCNSCGNVDRECTCRKCLFCQSSPPLLHVPSGPRHAWPVLRSAYITALPSMGPDRTPDQPVWAFQARPDNETSRRPYSLDSTSASCSTSMKGGEYGRRGS